MKPYNPLDRDNLGRSVTGALLSSPAQPLPPQPFEGAGLYAIYYVGPFAHYQARTGPERPIYVGKAVPRGARKGGMGDAGSVLFERLKEHAESIAHAKGSLDPTHFHCRYLVVDDIWIPLGESLLIERFQPLWNVGIDGFGNHDPGAGRYGQKKSPWDVLHPGRPWAEKLQGTAKSEEDILKGLK